MQAKKHQENYYPKKQYALKKSLHQKNYPPTKDKSKTISL